MLTNISMRSDILRIVLAMLRAEPGRAIIVSEPAVILKLYRSLIHF